MITSDAATNESDLPQKFDLQVNGYGGTDFNQDELSREDLLLAVQALEHDGVKGILPTIITEHPETMCRRIARLAQLREQDESARRMIAGIHIEGPFINPQDGFRGAHPLDAVRPADVDTMQQLLEEGKGLVRYVTLAPECDVGFKLTKMLSDQGVTVAAGHTNASLDELRGAIDHGLRVFTHLGNGCPAALPRHDNIVQRVLSLAEHLFITFIADGAHIPFFALKNYLDITGFDRAIVVSDAIAPAGLGPGRYTVSRWELEIGLDRVARSHDGGHLVGSAQSLADAEQHLRQSLNLDQTQISQLICSNPRKALGLV